MPKVCLETTFLIDFLRGVKEATQKVDHYESANIEAFATAISLYELHVGLLPNREAERLSLRSLENSIEIVPLSLPTAKEAATIMKELLAKGEPIPVNDAYIAGIARHYRVPVVTRDLNHYGKVANLRIETY